MRAEEYEVVENILFGHTYDDADKLRRDWLKAHPEHPLTKEYGHDDMPPTTAGPLNTGEENLDDVTTPAGKAAWDDMTSRAILAYEHAQEHGEECIGFVLPYLGRFSK